MRESLLRALVLPAFGLALVGCCEVRCRRRPSAPVRAAVPERAPQAAPTPAAAPTPQAGPEPEVARAPAVAPEPERSPAAGAAPARQQPRWHPGPPIRNRVTSWDCAMPGPGPRYDPYGPPATVLVADPEAGVYVISRGAEEGVALGSTWVVMRDGTPVARLRVVDVQAGQAAARLVGPAPEDPVRRGDDVEWAPRWMWSQDDR